VNNSRVLHASTSVLDIGYESTGDLQGDAVLLLHGFPYDVRAYDEASQHLADAGCRVIRPYLRGFGPTHFRSANTLRSGQQAAIAHDALDLLDALGIARVLVAGYDWGGRAACILAAIWPERVAGLVSCGGYAIQDIAAAMRPLPPPSEHALWYQYYFHGERGRGGLAAHRREFCKLLWQQWSPSWQFDTQVYDQTAQSFDNPDFVEVVIHSYRHRYGLIAGDPLYEVTERRLASRPPIAVPTVALFGGASGFGLPADLQAQSGLFSAGFRSEVVSSAGHNLPQESPQAFAEALLSLRR
jgi:pimeloyl-ACP methyl ester carboxylesterase